jgi:hypothetical protein
MLRYTSEIGPERGQRSITRVDLEQEATEMAEEYRGLQHCDREEVRCKLEWTRSGL